MCPSPLRRPLSHPDCLTVCLISKCQETPLGSPGTDFRIKLLLDTGHTGVKLTPQDVPYATGCGPSRRASAADRVLLTPSASLLPFASVLPLLRAQVGLPTPPPRPPLGFVSGSHASVQRASRRVPFGPPYFT